MRIKNLTFICTERMGLAHKGREIKKKGGGGGETVTLTVRRLWECLLMPVRA